MAVGVLHDWDLKAIEIVQYYPVAVDKHALEINVLHLGVVNEMAWASGVVQKVAEVTFVESVAK